MKSNSTDLEKLYNSDQYKLSNDLLSIRITKGMNRDFASKLLGINKEKYVKLESGDINTPLLKNIEMLY